MPYFLQLSKTLIISTSFIVLAACGGAGVQPGVSQAPTGGVTSGSTPGTITTPTVSTPSAGTPVGPNATAPQIFGDPVLAVAVGESYDFQAEVLDPNGDRVTFSIFNLPAWAKFDQFTGKLTGIPTAADVGSYSGITINVSDTHETASLGPFTVVVTQIATGSATISWVAPSRNTDGTSLTDLTGFHIHFGRSAKALTNVVKVHEPYAQRALVENLSPGPWYFAISAINSKGMQSALSGMGFKKIT